MDPGALIHDRQPGILPWEVPAPHSTSNHHQLQEHQFLNQPQSQHSQQPPPRVLPRPPWQGEQACQGESHEQRPHMMPSDLLGNKQQMQQTPHMMPSDLLGHKQQIQQKVPSKVVVATSGSAPPPPPQQQQQQQLMHAQPTAQMQSQMWAQPEQSQMWAQPEQSQMWAQPEQSQMWVQPEQSPMWVQPEQSQMWAQPEQAQMWAQPDQSQMWVQPQRLQAQPPMPSPPTLRPATPPQAQEEENFPPTHLPCMPLVKTDSTDSTAGIMEHLSVILVKTDSTDSTAGIMEHLSVNEAGRPPSHLRLETFDFGDLDESAALSVRSAASSTSFKRDRTSADFSEEDIFALCAGGRPDLATHGSVAMDLKGTSRSTPPLPLSHHRLHNPPLLPCPLPSQDKTEHTSI